MIKAAPTSMYYVYTETKLVGNRYVPVAVAVLAYEALPGNHPARVQADNAMMVDNPWGIEFDQG